MSTDTYNPIFEVLKYEIESFDSYYDAEDLISHFLRCSVASAWGYFDFEEAFDSVKTALEEKLGQHGLIDFNTYLEYERDIVSSRDIENLGTIFGIHNDYVCLDGDKIFEHIVKLKYETVKTEFESYEDFEELQNLVDKIENIQNYEYSFELVVLFDECIHAEHVTGQIFDIDIDSLKADIDNEILRGMEDN